MKDAGRKILFMRHGDTGLTGRWVGSSDVELSAEGAAQIAALAGRVDVDGFSRILLSPMRRCRQTLSLLDLDREGELLDDLREIDFGRWEKRSFSEISAEEPEIVHRWLENWSSFTFPGGERLLDFHRRVAHCKEILQVSDDDIFVIAHGGVIRILLCLLLNLSVENYLLFDVQPGRFCEIRLHSQGGVLTRFNCELP
ncbi:histidine phosphatase family protein [Desulforhopalus vacuolatus]|uniref:histidine phosphatase family protein n=1 Tax=Desulforhopalus vacuolatus TaxID=40414 RepID=UPI001963A73B|nr:histidine phosphatase family protein [Desulforhopalus vacuolatus]MBM9518980.1 histidine phosphatase family protein [Desulforhopalus vacuolatus]